MKRITLIINVFLLTGFVNGFAQSPNYLKAMEGLVGEIQAAQFGSSLQAQANKMERIAATEKTEWLPNYWVAYCYLMDSYAEQDGAKKDLLLDKADTFIENAEKLSKDNEEIEIMKANLASGRMAVSPQDRWQKYGGMVQKASSAAKKLNAENPRLALLAGQGLFYTPEAYGGGKAKAKPILEKALEYFTKFKPTSTIHPNWGMATTKWMLSQI